MGHKGGYMKETSGNEDGRKHWFFNHIVFTIICCSANILFTAHLAYLGGAISMIEKRFQMKSTQSGLFFTINDVVGLCTVLFITHFGQKTNRPRVIAFLFTLFGTGAALSALPNFLYDLPFSLQPDAPGGYNATTDADGGHSESIMCDAVTNDENAMCDAEKSSQSGALINEAWWIFLGQALAGLVSSTGPLMITFLDDNQNRKNTPLFIGIIFSSWTIGIVLGFFLANFCLRLPVTYPNIDPATTILDPWDPRFLGAWWLGLLICGLSIIIVVLPLFFFPGDLTGGRKPIGQEDKGGEMDSTESETGLGVIGALKDLLQASKRIVTNLTVVVLVLSTCCSVFSFVGLRAFSTKYMNTQFDIPVATASMLAGIIIIPCAVFGNITGGFIVKKLKLQKRGMVIMAVSLSVAGFMAIPCFFFAGCHQNPKAGLTIPYIVDTANISPAWTLPELESTCNEDCRCPPTYRPVCGSDGTTYSSPCHAGCNTETYLPTDSIDEGQVFTDCSCIPPTEDQQTPMATPGECLRDCTVAFHLIIGLFLSTFGSLTTAPNAMLKIRCVEDRDRSLVLGFVNVMTKLLAYIPGPIIWGALIDRSCVLFQESCGKTGNCVAYDTDRFRNIYYGNVLFVKLIDVLCLTMALLTILMAHKQAKKYQAMKAAKEADKPPPTLAENGRKEYSYSTV